MSWQLSGNAYVALAGLQTVYRTDIVQASTGHIIPRGGVGACHHPGGAQRDRMHLWTRHKSEDKYNRGSFVLAHQLLYFSLAHIEIVNVTKL